MVDHDEVGMSRVPILVILGATGTGKSRLGIEMAQKFAGEIISADSMQVYKGLDIITAKVTEKEKQMVPHHMLDVVDPLFNFNVVDFRNKALPIVSDLLAKGTMPVIVGGTNYYIESLLWQILIKDPNTPITNRGSIVREEPDGNGDECSPVKKMKCIRELEKTNEELYQRLKEVDPEMARRIHPNNRRKILRSLEIFEQHGTKQSELLKEQRQAGGSGLGGPLRHRNSIMLWLRCDTKILEERLNRRVDDMIEAGLQQELLDFHRRYNEDRIKLDKEPDYSKGIFQSIGFKEFHEWLILPEEERNSDEGQKLLRVKIEELKLATRQYARRQERWIRNRFIRRSDRQVPAVYSLDCTDVEQWKTNVYDKAVAIVSAFLRGETPEQKSENENVVNRKTTDSSNEEIHYCEVCNRTVVGTFQWNIHLKGSKHAKVLKKLARLKKKEEEKSQCENVQSS